MSESNLTANIARALLDYDAMSGTFVWKHRAGCKGFNTRYAGKTAGVTCPRGYVYIRIRRRGFYMAHRLAWLWVEGEWPAEEIDHADGNPSNNAWSNLRAATRSENAANRGVQKNSKTGIKGVFPSSKKAGRYAAQASMNGKIVKLGDFNSLDEAVAARAAAVAAMHGRFARG